MSCQCVISCDGDTTDTIHDEIRTARKDHRCCECRRTIAKRERYEDYFGKFDGDLCHYRTCMTCVEVRRFFSCNGGWMWTTVWQEVRDYLFPTFHPGCLEPQDDREPLSAAAKARVMEEWRKWKGLAA